MFYSLFFSLAVSFAINKAIYAEPITAQRLISEELESDGGHSSSFSGGGSVAASDLGSVRANPAMLPFDKQYAVIGTYHWPSNGRNFYQAGIIDSKTSSVAAGIMYSAPLSTAKIEEDGYNTETDVILKRRVSLGLAQAFSVISLGLSAQYVETNPLLTEKKTGLTFGLGIVGLLTPELRAGLSVENLANKELTDYAPTTYRAGLAYLIFKGDITLHLDYKQRERLEVERLSELTSPERLLITSASVRIQDLLRILAAYGTSVADAKPEQSRQLFSAGIALTNQNFALSYMLIKPDLALKGFHHGVSLSLSLAV